VNARRTIITSVVLLFVSLVAGAEASRLQVQQTAPASVALQREYLWHEAENMRGISANARHEPVLNPSWMQLPAAKRPGN
jgi:hypothetical protein